MRRLIIFIVLIILIPQVLAFKSKPANISDEELQKLIENDAPDEIPVSFWELPLWIKLHEIYTRLYWVLISLIFVLPFIILKLKNALDNRKRRRILEIIKECPGITITQLQKLTNMNRNTLRYHLSFLEKENLIYSIKVGSRKLLFSTDKHATQHLLLSDKKKQIIEILSKSNGISIRQLSEMLNISQKTVYYHIKNLKELGIVDVKEGRVFLLGEG